MEVYLGQRRSYDGALCTVRYRGPLEGTKGEWLGVEWDDVKRGKHDGEHEGQQIFKCLSSSPTAASFLRPSRKPDPSKTLLQAIKFKYGASLEKGAFGNADGERIAISGKVVEEVGFERIQQQQSVLSELRIVLVDELVVSGMTQRNASREEVAYAQRQLSQTCPNITELDLGWNPIETWQEMADICASLTKLRVLKASGLRLRSFAAQFPEHGHSPFGNVEELHLNECLIRPAETLDILSFSHHVWFPSLKTLSLSQNELDCFRHDQINDLQFGVSIKTLILDNNAFQDLSFLPDLLSIFPETEVLSLQGCLISELGPVFSGDMRSFGKLESLSLAGNRIPSFSFIDSLPSLFPNLTSLRISRNPLYDHPSSDLGLAASKRSDSIYYLTLARIPNLKSLNYTTITARDREEGEIYYLFVAEKDITSMIHERDGETSLHHLLESARSKYRRYESLCQKYDRDSIFLQYAHQSATAASASIPVQTYAPGTLGARLVHTTFYIRPTPGTKSRRHSWTRLAPLSVSSYHLKAVLARHFQLPRPQFRLIYESVELDPVRESAASDNWDEWGDWDVDQLSVEDGYQQKHEDEPEAKWVDNGYLIKDGQKWKKRETEILDGTKPWGDYLEDGVTHARIRIEP